MKGCFKWKLWLDLGFSSWRGVHFLHPFSIHIHANEVSKSANECQFKQLTYVVGVFGSFNAYCPTIEKVVPCLSDGLIIMKDCIAFGRPQGPPWKRLCSHVENGKENETIMVEKIWDGGGNSWKCICVGLAIFPLIFFLVEVTFALVC